MGFLSQYRNRRRMKHFRNDVKQYRHQCDDVLYPEQKTALDRLIGDTGEALAAGDTAPAKLASFRERLAKTVPIPRFQTLREWLDIIAVVGAVAFGFRGLFIQTFKIPTSSMQPTLYGVHYMAEEGASNPLLAKLPMPLNTLLFSARRAELTVREAGLLDPESFRLAGNWFFDAISFRIGGVGYTLPGDIYKVAEYTGLSADRRYQAGEVLAKGYLSLGDHLFVDRIGHNLTGLKRGDITVFCTENIYTGDGVPLTQLSGYYYVKRLAGLPGDTLRIVGNQLLVRPKGDDRFHRIQDLAPVFAKIYSGRGGYQGHANSPGDTNCAFYLASPEAEFTVPPDHYFMLGDNTKYSSDSRIWGTVPRRNIVGRALFVFWPFSRRWGLIDRAEPLPVPTGASRNGTFPSMYLQ